MLGVRLLQLYLCMAVAAGAAGACAEHEQPVCKHDAGACPATMCCKTLSLLFPYNSRNWPAEHFGTGWLLEATRTSSVFQKRAKAHADRAALGMRLRNWLRGATAQACRLIRCRKCQTGASRPKSDLVQDSIRATAHHAVAQASFGRACQALLKQKRPFSGSELHLSRTTGQATRCQQRAHAKPSHDAQRPIMLASTSIYPHCSSAVPLSAPSPGCQVLRDNLTSPPMLLKQGRSCVEHSLQS